VHVHKNVHTTRATEPTTAALTALGGWNRGNQYRLATRKGPQVPRPELTMATRLQALNGASMLKNPDPRQENILVLRTRDVLSCPTAQARSQHNPISSEMGVVHRSTQPELEPSLRLVRGRTGSKQQQQQQKSVLLNTVLPLALNKAHHKESSLFAAQAHRGTSQRHAQMFSARQDTANAFEGL
jgi:hypothetical protein